MNDVEINKLEWDLVTMIDVGKSDDEITKSMIRKCIKNEDLVKVIRQLYAEVRAANSTLSKIKDMI